VDYIRTAEILMTKYQTDEPHVRHVAKLADTLFDKLGALHRLEERDRLTLELAAYLHDIGHFVGEKDHHRTGCCLILADEELREWEDDVRNCVAYAALNHRKRKRLEWAGAPLNRRSRMDSIAALLRIADVLDREHDQRSNLEMVRYDPEKRLVLLELEGIPLVDMAKKLNKKLQWACNCWKVDFVLKCGMDRISVQNI
jgi:exopolyphosphatase/pppGpp-phosphohydrolase